MFLIILAIAVVAGLFVFLGFGDELSWGLKPRQFLSLFGLVVLLFGTFKIVPVNSVGIIFNPFSGVKEEVLTEGFKMKTPLDVIYVISTEVQTKNVVGVTGQTKDAQWIKMDMDIKYSVSQSNAFIVFKKFKTLINVDEKLIQPIVQRAVEQVTTQYNVIDILGEKRNEVYIQIEEVVTKKLSESGVELFSLVLTDTDAGENIESAIVREAVAKKEVETAMQSQERARIEAETKVIEAESAAKVKIIEAETLAKSNELLSKSITDNILRKMELEARLKFGWVEVTGAQLLIGQ